MLQTILYKRTTWYANTTIRLCRITCSQVSGTCNRLYSNRKMYTTYRRLVCGKQHRECEPHGMRSLHAIRLCCVTSSRDLGLATSCTLTRKCTLPTGRLVNCEQHRERVQPTTRSMESAVNEIRRASHIKSESPLLLNKCGYGLNPTSSREKHLP